MRTKGSEGKRKAEGRKRKRKYEAKVEEKEARKRDKERWRTKNIAEQILQDELHYCHGQIKNLKNSNF